MGNIVANRRAFPEDHGTHQVKVTGIKNLGSTCYMNTLIQSLFVTPVFRIKINECLNVDESIASDLQDIFIRLEQGVHSVEPYRLARSLDQMHWAVNRQQDIEEFFHMVINAIDDKEIRKVYEMGIVNSLSCTGCKHEMIKETANLDISLTLKASPNEYFKHLEEALRHFVKNETMQGDDKPFCGSCKTKQVMIRKASFSTLPPVLVIHLNRFTHDSWKHENMKLEQPLLIPEALTFKRCGSEAGIAQHASHTSCRTVWKCIVVYTLSQQDCVEVHCGLHSLSEQDCVHYELFSISVHAGNLDCGHYYAFIKHHEDRQWYICDDTSIRKTHWNYIQEKLRMNDLRWLDAHSVTGRSQSYSRDHRWSQSWSHRQVMTSGRSSAILLMYEVMQ
ncbi:ubiquitin carboxyl-terminal hydrolase 47-like [Acipenser oxyrinchus oxyrinchus]|uniref:Ubiquitin carboxyl-terminal hydrolase 47-like n=1 Tax=Acipenser oxyrinchus oxyrinchus TaxID=40147 RepID=A0AAD8DE66_ACIOX|nr:ubiquitin carboxyl-terminal hydrolase 47-like [Acipenser oxyrinchus oxyrinchus]